MGDATDGFEEVAGERIQKLRTAYGLTREQLASMSGVSVDTIQRIEHGSSSPSLETMERISRGMGITLPTLFSVLETGQRDYAAELCDLLSGLRRNEVERLRRVLGALFDSDVPHVAKEKGQSTGDGEASDGLDGFARPSPYARARPEDLVDGEANDGIDAMAVVTPASAHAEHGDRGGDPSSRLTSNNSSDRDPDS